MTALFADIVGSTGLGERMSPDEVKALVGECVTRMSRVVEEFGGTVQAYMGDGVCAYFGVPTAHEDDADRAAEAGLAVLAMVGRTAATSARHGTSRSSTSASGSTAGSRPSAWWAPASRRPWRSAT